MLFTSRGGEDCLQSLFGIVFDNVSFARAREIACHGRPRSMKLIEGFAAVGAAALGRLRLGRGLDRLRGLRKRCFAERRQAKLAELVLQHFKLVALILFQIGRKLGDLADVLALFQQCIERRFADALLDGDRLQLALRSPPYYMPGMIVCPRCGHAGAFNTRLPVGTKLKCTACGQRQRLIASSAMAASAKPAPEH
jgi:hypothetical protein